MRAKLALCGLWLIAVGLGFCVILNYQSTAGYAGVAPRQWPPSAQIPLDRQRDTLVMFAHPRCPCTRASIEELNRLMGRSQGKVAACVLFLKPDGFSGDWTHTDLWRSVTAIPGVQTREDLDGSQARLFGAETSGQVLLYDTQGRLLFQGGITGSRGHAGDNAGEEAVLSRLSGRAALSQTPVYGCSLLGECKSPAEGASQ